MLSLSVALCDRTRQIFQKLCPQLLFHKNISLSTNAISINNSSVPKSMRNDAAGHMQAAQFSEKHNNRPKENQQQMLLRTREWEGGIAVLNGI